MNLDRKKVRGLLARNVTAVSPDELRREENVFFVGGNLPERQTLETLFESHYQSHAALFHLTFGGLGTFQNGENLARVIKKNFNAHLVARMNFAPSPQLVARAYAAGVDIIDIPLNVAELKPGERLDALESARSVFPRWSVASSLTAGEEPASSTMAEIDALLSADVVPLVTLSPEAGSLAAAQIEEIFVHLDHEWQSKKAVIKPLLPLIYLSTPFAPTASRGVVRGLIDII
jgi:hypothetical protein